MNDIPAGVDEKLLSVLIRPGAIEEIVATGVAPEHFIVPLYGSIYQWAIGYHRDHGVAPTKLAIETTWPPFQVEDAVEEAPKWLATALCKRARRNILNDTLLKAATNADDDPDGTWRWLAEKATAAVNRLENAGSEGLSLRRLCDVAPQRVEWLWSGYLPLGKLVVLDGDPDIGKSTLATGFAAVVSAGGMWPDRSRCAAADVLIMSAEENPEDIIRPRLDAAGGDPARVTTIEGGRSSTPTATGCCCR